MKRILLIILLIAAVSGVKAQRQSPVFFHNHLEYMTYLVEHPEYMPLKATDAFRTDYTQKLDSIVGTDDFDSKRWKNIYTYGNAESDMRNEAENDIMVETSYEWKNQTWEPTLKTEINKATDVVNYYQWNEGNWESFYTITSCYSNCGDQRLLDSVLTTRLMDSAWVATARSTYEYNENCQLVLIMNYNGTNNNGDWNPSSKYVYNYDSLGVLATCVISTVRNGNWMESQQDIYAYDDLGQCISLLTRRKGGWGPGGGSWMDDHKYTFEYEDGQLASETLYMGGWFSSDMSLDSKSEYYFDVNGNEERKTASVYNESDWIVRDVYENHFDLSVNADEVLGLASVWESTLGNGMGFVLDTPMPLVNKWLSCSIVSSNLDTEFTLYCSGFEGVDEHHEDLFKVSTREGRLIVENAEPMDVTVYDLLGRVIASRKNASSCEFQLNAGLYLIGNGTSFVKAVVR